MAQYKIIAATKPWQRSKYIIVKRSWYWPFWVQATNYSYPTIENAKDAAKVLLTDVKITKHIWD